MAGLTNETLAEARRLVALYPEKRSALVPLCHMAQAQDGWLTPAAIRQIAELLELAPAEVRGTASFYEMLRTEEVGRHLVSVCTNIACLLGGAYELLEHIQGRLGIRPGATTADGEFTLEEAECIAACDKAPCLQVNYRFFGPVSPEAFDGLVGDLSSGRLEREVPSHGVLSRVRREPGLSVAHEQIARERAAADAAAEERAKAAEGSSAGGGS